MLSNVSSNDPIWLVKEGSVLMTCSQMAQALPAMENVLSEARHLTFAEDSEKECSDRAIA